MGDAEVTAPADAHQIERPSGFLDRHLWKAIIVGRLSLCQLEDPCPCKEPCLEIGSVDRVRPVRDPIQHIACARPDQADGRAGGGGGGFWGAEKTGRSPASIQPSWIPGPSAAGLQRGSETLQSPGHRPAIGPQHKGYNYPYTTWRLPWRVRHGYRDRSSP
jgi:hypothetical protein